MLLVSMTRGSGAQVNMAGTGGDSPVPYRCKCHVVYVLLGDGKHQPDLRPSGNGIVEILLDMVLAAVPLLR